jgi:transcriptional regulator with XRE-family HTH domain
MHDPASNPAAFLGAELRRARVAAGFASQEALAARLGYDRTVIAKAETGERPPTPEVADARRARRAIFDKPDPPDVVVVLDESVLHRLIGSPQVMHDQLTEIAELSARSYISVQVVPAGNGANAGLGGALNIAGGDGTPDVVHMDAVEGQTTERRALVRKAAVAFDRLRGDALSRGQSRDLILRLADELWKT